MSPFRTVLCATDLTADADTALRQADRLARAAEARLLVFHALPGMVPSSPLFPAAAEEGSEAFLALERHVLRSMSERVAVITGRVGPEVTLKLGSGSAHSAIVAEAEAERADLIVVGGAVKTGVAERVVRYAHCPVLIARRGAGEGPIVVGTDFSRSAGPAVEVAAQLATKWSAALRLVHALSIEGQVPYGVTPSQTPAFPVYSGEDVVKLREAAEQHLAELSEPLGASASFEASDLRPADALVEIARREHARLIVVGTAGHTGLKRILMGSVAEDVVRKAECPVLVARR